MTAREAGRIIRKHLADTGASGITVTAREVSFEDLARDSRVFVTLKGAPSYADRAFWGPVQATGEAHGFTVD